MDVLKPVQQLGIKIETRHNVTQNLPDSRLVLVQLAIMLTARAHRAALDQVRQCAVLVVLHLDEQDVPRLRTLRRAAA